MMYFLSGLPRSGSTVLAALLNQRNDIHVTPTSGLIDIFGSVVQTWENNPSTKGQRQTKEHLYETLRRLIPVREDGKITVDKSRGWVAPQVQKTMGEVLGSPVRIVATVRDVATCAASFAKISKPENLAEFCNGQLIGHLKGSYASLYEGYTEHPENILFVDYDELMLDPQAVVAKIEAFWNLQPFAHDFNNIDGESVAEDDENAWGVAGLHDVKPELKNTNTSAKDILGEFEYRFQAPKFWIGETEPKKDVLDFQVEAAVRGEFDSAESMCKTIAELRPQDDRAAFNRGWYALRHGNLKEGFELLDRGRNEEVFGNPNPSSMPKYDGRPLNGEVVLLVLEGGRGDQIHAARWAREIVSRGGVCVVSCMPELAGLMMLVDGVSAVVESMAAGGVYHDYHVLGMSGYLSFLTVNNAPYIPCKTIKPNGKIGLRWQGNPKFEHEQNRVFDPALLFTIPAELISLQRDIGIENIPDHVQKPCLDTWLHTKAVIESVDKVISSCTSVAHLAAAMGKETWIISPVLPYYLWADGKESSIWYRNVRLFRQEKFGDWDTTLAKVTSEFNQNIRRVK
jgi:hypothetical protein